MIDEPLLTEMFHYSTYCAHVPKEHDTLLFGGFMQIIFIEPLFRIQFDEKQPTAPF